MTRSHLSIYNLLDFHLKSIKCNIPFSTIASGLFCITRRAWSLWRIIFVLFFMAHQRLCWGILSQLKGQQMTQVIAVFHSAVMCPWSSSHKKHSLHPLSPLWVKVKCLLEKFNITLTDLSALPLSAGNIYVVKSKVKEHSFGCSWLILVVRSQFFFFNTSSLHVRKAWMALIIFSKHCRFGKIWQEEKDLI